MKKCSCDMQCWKRKVNKEKGNIKYKVLSSSMLGLKMVIVLMGIDFTVLKPRYNSMKKLINILIAASLYGLIAIREFSTCYISKLNIHPFIASLAVMSITRGLAYIICSGEPVFIWHDLYLTCLYTVETCTEVLVRDSFTELEEVWCIFGD